jgi:hypothetical protein
LESDNLVKQAEINKELQMNLAEKENANKLELAKIDKQGEEEKQKLQIQFEKMKGEVEIKKQLISKTKDLDANQLISLLGPNLFNQNENKPMPNNTQNIPMQMPAYQTPMGNQNLYFNQNQFYGYQNQQPLNYPQYSNYQSNMGLYNSQNLNMNCPPNGVYNKPNENMNYMGMFNYQNPPQYNLQNSGNYTQNINNSYQNMQQSAPNIPVPLH